MRNHVIVLLAGILLGWPWTLTQASPLGDVFKRVTGSVVVVLTEERVLPPHKHEGKRVSVQGLGSGVLISEDGKVLTAAHVVQTADRVGVEFLSGEIIEARVITSDPPADVALLQLERAAKNAVVAELGDSDRVEIADEVFVLGAPYGLGHTLTVGHISARRVPAIESGDFALAVFFSDRRGYQ